MKNKPKKPKLKCHLNLNKDQHLLKDKRIIKKEVSLAEIKNKDRIIEIGGGKGYLTKKLAESRASEVLCFEIDKSFKPYLDELKKHFQGKLKVKYKNALKFPHWKDYNKIISNIPYSLSEPLIQKAIQSDQEKLVLVVGERFKEKLTSVKDSIKEKDASTIGLIADLFYNIKPIKKIPKHIFIPQPGTDSWLITLTRKSASQIRRKEKILQHITQYQGKIKNAIMWSLIQEANKTKNQAREIIKSLGLNKQVLEKPTTRITGKFILKLKKEVPEYIE